MIKTEEKAMTDNTIKVYIFNDESLENKYKYRITVSGSRGITDYNTVESAILSFLSWKGLSVNEIEIIHGGCPRSPDEQAEVFKNKYKIPGSVFRAKWKTEGKAAGPLRNKRMIECSHGLVAIWDGRSRGTKGTIEMAEEAGLDVYVKQIGD